VDNQLHPALLKQNQAISFLTTNPLHSHCGYVENISVLSARHVYTLYPQSLLWTNKHIYPSLRFLSATQNQQTTGVIAGLTRNLKPN